jgi:hypothetical protein
MENKQIITTPVFNEKYFTRGGAYEIVDVHAKYNAILIGLEPHQLTFQAYEPCCVGSITKITVDVGSVEAGKVVIAPLVRERKPITLKNYTGKALCVDREGEDSQNGTVFTVTNSDCRMEERLEVLDPRNDSCRKLPYLWTRDRDVIFY